MKIFLIILAVWNTAVMLVYGFDKICAKKGRRRVRESNLLTLAFVLGSVGALYGMVLFNHKTAKLKFRLTVPLFVIIHIALWWYLRRYI